MDFSVKKINWENAPEGAIPETYQVLVDNKPIVIPAPPADMTVRELATILDQALNSPGLITVEQCQQIANMSITEVTSPYVQPVYEPDLGIYPARSPWALE